LEFVTSPYNKLESRRNFNSGWEREREGGLMVVSCQRREGTSQGGCSEERGRGAYRAELSHQRMIIIK
jgi:hypothetical protein